MKKTAIALFLAGALSLVGLGSLSVAKASDNDKVQDEIVLDNMTVSNGDDALSKLKLGNKLYVNDMSKDIDNSSSKRASLQNKQNPFAVVVSCSDSRVITSEIFNTGIGDIFDIKLAGNVVDDLALGSIEYGVEHLNVPLLVVMGHENCGAVTAAYNNAKKGEAVTGNIKDIVEKIEPAVENANSIDEATHNNIYDVIEQVKKDEVIDHLVQQGKLKVVGAYYDLDGQVHFLENV